GQLAIAKVVGEEMLALCTQTGDPIAAVQAHYGHGVTLYGLFALDAAIPHFQAALAAYDPATHPTHVSVYGGYDPGVGCECWLGWTHWYRGEADRAVAFGTRGLELADRLGHRFSIAFACSALGLVRLQRGEVEIGGELAARGAAIC